MKKELEILERELFLKSDAISSATTGLEKANTLLSHWTQEFHSIERPSPKAAMEYWNGDNESNHAKQSAKWICEYNYIYQVIEIVQDYILATNEILNKTLEVKESTHEKLKVI